MKITNTAEARAEATRSAKRTAMILGIIAVTWYFGFMAMRLI